MAESRWLPRLGPPTLALATLVLLGSVRFGAAAEPWEPPRCAGGLERATAAGRMPPPAGPGDVAKEPWFRLDPRLGSDGALAGQRLTLGDPGRRGSRSIDLPPESSSAGPFGRLVLAAADDGERSRIFAFDVAAACAILIAEEADVVRRVTIDPSAAFLYEHRVDRTTRSDLGVWRRSLEDGGPAERVVDALPPDPRFGETWSTELSWSREALLAVQSCGSLACRTRVIDPATGGVSLLEDPSLGELLGHRAGWLLSYAACHGLPCPVLRTDGASGRSEVVVEAAGIAVLIDTPEGPRLVHEATGPASWLRSIDPATGAGDVVGAVPTGLRLVPGTSRTHAGVRLPDGWVLLSEDGRAGRSGAVLVDVLSGRVHPVAEVAR